ncbi:hypothetical protein SVAN01_01228 [Stagonosporopsis vannaccii]|nr:hypothetical protein SVAN01_01228 [Stagonosporopsis vannaccii]
MAELARSTPALLAVLPSQAPATSNQTATSRRDTFELLSSFQNIKEALEHYREAVSATTFNPSIVLKPTTNESTASAASQAAHDDPVREWVGVTALSKVGLSGQPPAMADGSIRGPQCVVM